MNVEQTKVLTWRIIIKMTVVSVFGLTGIILGDMLLTGFLSDLTIIGACIITIVVLFWIIARAIFLARAILSEKRSQSN